MRILTINTGSSSIKFQLYNMKSESLHVTGRIESIGDKNAEVIYKHYGMTGDTEEYRYKRSIQDHQQGLNILFQLLDKLNQLNTLDAVGHRVVHGGESLHEAVVIDDKVKNAIYETKSLAPLHSTANLTGIDLAQKLFPAIPHVAVFDTAFFHSLPLQTSQYALSVKLSQQHHIRRYGFHGISHQSVTKQAANFLSQPINSLRLITCHLGNGASMAAIRYGECIDTSMGMTPLEGLIMGTRSGDLDPSIVIYLIKTLGMQPAEVETMLNNDSGMKGLCGVSDMRDVHRLIKTGNKQAQLALDMYCYRIIKYIGAYYVALNGLDALIFTGGVGENDPVIRESVCNGLAAIGICLDQSVNLAVAESKNQCHVISQQDGVKILVIPSNEELEIARQTVFTVQQMSGSESH